MKRWREIAIDHPPGALPPPAPVPGGMRAWKNAKNGFVVVACHYSADPRKRNDEWYDEACRNLRPDQIERELEINFDSRAGAKAFPYLENHASVFRSDPPYPIPANWKIIVGMDYGSANPTSVHWYAVDENRCFWCFDEFYCPMQELKGGLPVFADYLKNHPYYTRAQYIVCDPKMFAKDQNVLVAKENGVQAYGTVMSIADMLIRDYGIHKLRPANNDRIAGITRVHQMFNWRGDPVSTKSYLHVGARCGKMWWELCNLVHKPDDNQSKNADEDVVKRNDHAFDELKYALLSQDIPAAHPTIDPRAGFATLKVIEDEIDERYRSENEEVFESVRGGLEGFAEDGDYFADMGLE